MKLPKGSKVIPIEVYNLSMVLLTSESQARNLIKLNGLDDYEFYCEGRVNTYIGSDGGWGISMYISKEAGPDVLAHECVHAAHFIMERVGIPSNYDNSEVEAYLVQYIFRKCYKILKRRFK